MKKLLLIPLLFLITPDTKADMDYICEVSFEGDKEGFAAHIRRKCQRGNIFLIRQVPRINIPWVIAIWCRHDREINFVENTLGDGSIISCVLYDIKPRKIILKD